MAKSKLLKAKKREKRRARYTGGRLDMRTGGRVALQRGGLKDKEPGEKDIRDTRTSDSFSVSRNEQNQTQYTPPPVATESTSTPPPPVKMEPPVDDEPQVTDDIAQTEQYTNIDPDDIKDRLWWWKAGFSTLEDALNAGWTVDTKTGQGIPPSTDDGEGDGDGDGDGNGDGDGGDDPVYVPDTYTADEVRMKQGAQEVYDSVMGEGASGKSVIPDATHAGGYQLDEDGNPLKDEDGNPIPVVRDMEAKSIAEGTGKIKKEDIATAGGYVKNEDGSFARDADGNLIPVIAPETVSTIDEIKKVDDAKDVTASTYTATQIADEDVKVFDPASGKVTPDMIAEVQDGTLTKEAEGITISDEEAAKSLADTITGTMSPGAKADAIKNAGTTLPRVLRAKKQLRNAGLTEEQINAFGDDPVALEDELMNYTEEERKMIGNLPEEALMGNQMSQLLSGIENGEVPNWAKPAYASVMQGLAARGMDVSTVGRDALLNVIIQSAMPIAQSNAEAIQRSVMQQVDIEAKAAEADAQRAQQVGMQNAQNVFNMDMANFQAEQQTELFNKKFLQTVSLTNADRKQQATLQNAAAQANMDIANLGKNERLAAQNAKTFLNMEMTNMSLDQQSRVINTQARNQAMLSNQAADNFAKNANATRETDVDKFMSDIAVRVDTINAAAENNMKSFNASAKNAAEARRIGIEADISKANAAMINDISKHNSMVEFERNKFNTDKAQMVEMSNIDHRRKVNLANTAADNAVAFQNAMNSFKLQETSMAMIWQENRDKYHYEWQGAQNEATRKTQLLATALGNDGAGAAENWSSTIGSLLGTINNAKYGAAETGD